MQLPEGIRVQRFRLRFMDPGGPAHEKVEIPPHDGVGSMLGNEHAGAAPGMGVVIAKGIVQRMVRSRRVAHMLAAIDNGQAF